MRRNTAFTNMLLAYCMYVRKLYSNQKIKIKLKLLISLSLASLPGYPIDEIDNR